MARITVDTIAVPAADCRREIAAGFGSESEETRNRAFLEAMLRAFQDTMQEYYNGGATTEDRFYRLDEIRQAVVEIGFTDGARTFTIAPALDLTGPNPRKVCDAPRVCHCGVCVLEEEA